MDTELILKIGHYSIYALNWWKITILGFLAAYLAFRLFKNKKCASFKMLKFTAIGILVFSLADVFFRYFFQVYIFKLSDNFFSQAALENPSYLKIIAANLLTSLVFYSLITSLIVAGALFVLRRLRSEIISNKEILLFFIFSFLIGWKLMPYYILASMVFMVLIHIYLNIRDKAVSRLSIYPYLIFSTLPFFLWLIFTSFK